MRRIDRRIITVLRANQGAARVLEIVKEGGFTHAGAWRVYASLDRLMLKRYVDSYVSEVDGRTVYSLTGRYFHEG